MEFPLFSFAMVEYVFESIPFLLKHIVVRSCSTLGGDNFLFLVVLCLCPLFPSLLGYEGLEVINPEGGKEDAEEEAQKGRWKQEVYFSALFAVV